MLPTEARRSPSASAADGVVTADMVAQHAYCPRRFHLAYLEGRWADNAFTDEGRLVHRRVDGADDLLPDPENHPDRPVAGRSVSLSDEAVGLHAKLDLVETAADDGPPAAVPVETKRGKSPDEARGPWEADQEQLIVQGLLLRANGYASERGIVYYAASRKRMDVPFTAELEARTLRRIEAIRLALGEPGAPLPAPLEDSPKCPGCSLAGICLPDETAALREDRSDAEGSEPAVRRLFPARDDALPLYVQEQGAYVGKRGEGLVVTKGRERLAAVKLKDVSQLVLCGGVSVSAPTLHLLCEAGVPVVHLSRGHWFYGVTTGTGLRNSFDRAAQFRRAEDPAWCLDLARALVAAKGANQRTMLRRNGKEVPAGDLDEMRRLLRRVDGAPTVEGLLGIEGSVAAVYFRSFGRMLRPRAPDGGGAEEGLRFDFSTRNRRPPRDPVNAMLSFGYAMLAKDATVALLGVGLDPYWGFYHRPRHGRPALALDLMEEFRPLVVDSAVVTAINTGAVTPSDFEVAAAGCALGAGGRKAFVRAYEARMDQMVTHPRFDYRCSWRRILALQAQVLARVIRGDLPVYEGMRTR